MRCIIMKRKLPSSVSIEELMNEFSKFYKFVKELAHPAYSPFPKEHLLVQLDGIKTIFDEMLDLYVLASANFPDFLEVSLQYVTIAKEKANLMNESNLRRLLEEFCQTTTLRLFSMQLVVATNQVHVAVSNAQELQDIIDPIKAILPIDQCPEFASLSAHLESIWRQYAEKRTHQVVASIIIEFNKLLQEQEILSLYTPEAVIPIFKLFGNLLIEGEKIADLPKGILTLVLKDNTIRKQPLESIKPPLAELSKFAESHNTSETSQAIDLDVYIAFQDLITALQNFCDEYSECMRGVQSDSQELKAAHVAFIQCKENFESKLSTFEERYCLSPSLQSNHEMVSMQLTCCASVLQTYTDRIEGLMGRDVIAWIEAHRAFFNNMLSAYIEPLVNRSFQTKQTREQSPNRVFSPSDKSNARPNLGNRQAKVTVRIVQKEGDKISLVTENSVQNVTEYDTELTVARKIASQVGNSILAGSYSSAPGPKESENRLAMFEPVLEKLRRLNDLSGTEYIILPQKEIDEVTAALHIVENNLFPQSIDSESESLTKSYIYSLLDTLKAKYEINTILPLWRLRTQAKEASGVLKSDNPDIELLIKQGMAIGYLLESGITVSMLLKGGVSPENMRLAGIPNRVAQSKHVNRRVQATYSPHYFPVLSQTVDKAAIANSFCILADSQREYPHLAYFYLVCKSWTHWKKREKLPASNELEGQEALQVDLYDPTPVLGCLPENCINLILYFVLSSFSSDKERGEGLYKHRLNGSGFETRFTYFNRRRFEVITKVDAHMALPVIYPNDIAKM
jgi:hypothetical protein